MHLVWSVLCLLTSNRIDHADWALDGWMVARTPARRRRGLLVLTIRRRMDSMEFALTKKEKKTNNGYKL